MGEFFADDTATDGGDNHSQPDLFIQVAGVDIPL